MSGSEARASRWSARDGTEVEGLRARRARARARGLAPHPHARSQSAPGQAGGEARRLRARPPARRRDCAAVARPARSGRVQAVARLSATSSFRLDRARAGFSLPAGPRALSAAAMVFPTRALEFAKRVGKTTGGRAWLPKFGFTGAFDRRKGMRVGSGGIKRESAAKAPDTSDASGPARGEGGGRRVELWEEEVGEGGGRRREGEGRGRRTESGAEDFSGRFLCVCFEAGGWSFCPCSTSRCDILLFFIFSVRFQA